MDKQYFKELFSFVDSDRGFLINGISNKLPVVFVDTGTDMPALMYCVENKGITNVYLTQKIGNDFRNIGYASFTIDGAVGGTFLNLIKVNCDLRSQGLGGELIDYVQYRSCLSGSKFIVGDFSPFGDNDCVAKKRALAFYESNGFEVLDDNTNIEISCILSRIGEHVPSNKVIYKKIGHEFAKQYIKEFKNIKNKILLSKKFVHKYEQIIVSVL